MRQAFVVERPQHAALRALNYEPSVEQLRRPKRGRRHVRLRELVADLGSGYATVFARVDCERSFGVELLSQTDMFAAEPEGRVIRRDSMHRPERHEVSPWQVLVAGAGTLAPTELYGRAVIADDRLSGKFVGQDSLIIAFSNPEDDFSLFAYAYLASPTGVRALRSASYGTKILRIRRDILADLPVPRADDRVIATVADAVRRAVAARNAFSKELSAARSLLDRLPEMREAMAKCAERRSRAVMWDRELVTLMGWTYASHGGALALLREKWRASVGDALTENGAFYGLLRQRTPCSAGFGVPLITQRDALSVRPLASWIARPGVPERALFSPPHSIVMAGRGTLGEGELFARPAYITPGLSHFALTQDLLRLVPREGYEALLHVFLTTLVGRRLLRACATGTKIMQLRLDLLRQIPLPELDRDAVGRLRAHHDRSVAAYDEAAQAEGEAFRIVEEEVLPAWLA